MWLTLRFDWDGEVRIVRVCGEVDISSAPQFAQCLRTALLESRAGVILDLKDVSFVDGRGLRVLHRFSQDCRDRGLPIALTHVSPHIRRLLRLVGFDHVLPIVDDSIPANQDRAPAIGARDDPGLVRTGHGVGSGFCSASARKAVSGSPR